MQLCFWFDTMNYSPITSPRLHHLQELLVQLRHYSPTSKREALAGLKTIIDRHKGFAEVNFARLAEASLELAVVSDDEVRK